MLSTMHVCRKQLTALLWGPLILLVCIIGDKTVSSLQGAANNKRRALADNITHGMVAFFSWAVVTDYKMAIDKSILECLVCMLLAMVVDVDHFIMAKSFSLQNALSLSHRPPFHATTIIPIIFIILWCCSFVFNAEGFRLLAFISLTALLSHHIRDATRRGLWMPPFGTLTPFSYGVYVLLTLALPLVIKIMFTRFVREDAEVSHAENDAV